MTEGELRELALIRDRKLHTFITIMMEIDMIQYLELLNKETV